MISLCITHLIFVDILIHCTVFIKFVVTLFGLEIIYVDNK